MLRLVIGNRNYSSWSLRAWLFLRMSGIAFEEIRIPLFTGSWREEVGRYGPSARVPILLDGDLAVWDTLSIFAYVRERSPEAVGWPRDRRARALARSVVAEMHSGFIALRGELPQNLRARRRRSPDELSARCLTQVQRIQQIWSECRERHGDMGPWLFGELSIADIMFAPVALRFVTYSIPLTGRGQEYAQAIQRLPEVRGWISLAEREEESIDFIDNLVPADQAALTLG